MKDWILLVPRLVALSMLLLVDALRPNPYRDYLERLDRLERRACLEADRYRREF